MRFPWGAGGCIGAVQQRNSPQDRLFQPDLSSPGLRKPRQFALATTARTECILRAITAGTADPRLEELMQGKKCTEFINAKIEVGGLGAGVRKSRDRSSGARRDGFAHISPARSIFSNALNFCRSAIAGYETVPTGHPPTRVSSPSGMELL
jgi:hypothetical protein